MNDKAFQNYYEDAHSICFGCGRLNDMGLKIKSYWDGDESVCRFTPHSYHTAMAGYVYGGILASVIDCHGTGTAAAAAYRAAGRDMGTAPHLRFVTASLHVDYLKPTPIDTTLELRGKVRDIRGRRVVVDIVLRAKGETCVKGEVVAVRVPDHLL
ncbi:MAG: PaaI family thioesterase [Deltaproteobacteria bacterium]|nr:PaaI family thioesterase [Deltaproteobacteria bacterium]